MRQFKFLIVLLFVATLLSCGGGASDQSENAKGFQNIENELKDKFGNDAHYTDLSIIRIDGIGNTISLTATENPKSLKMGQWNLSQDTWNQTSDVTIEVPEGTKASDFMFQLGEDISLSKLGELVEKSKAQLKKEKDLDNPVLKIASVKFPKNGNLANTEYVVSLEPENGGTSFSFFYSLDGDLLNMNY